MNPLWISLSQRIGSCVSRLSQSTTALSSSLTHSTCFSSLVDQTCSSISHRISSLLPSSSTQLLLQPSNSVAVIPSRSVNFEYMHRKGIYSKVRKKKNHPLDGNPQMRGVILKTLVKKPKKPNSANRKCVRLRLTNGKEVTAYIPGEGHNLQEHNIVLVQGGKLQDTPGVKLVCVRGKYDLPHVKKRA